MTRFSICLTAALFLLAPAGSWCQTDDAKPVPATKKKPRSKLVRPDKKQPWLKANRFKVETVGGAPRVTIRFFNDHETRAAEGIKELGSGTARDDYGVEYKAFSRQMVSSLEPGKSHSAELSLLPKLSPKARALLLLLHPVGERVVYVQLERNEKSWEIDEYGAWKDKQAYKKQDEWAADRKKENPYKEAAAEVREWNDNTGEFTIRASFVDFKVDKKKGKSFVSLKRADNGKTIEVAHQRLSAADQKYIRDLKKKLREKE